MPKDDAIYAELGVLWKSDPGRNTLASGKLTGEATVFLGLPPGTGLLLQRVDKGDNANRPDYRITLVMDAAGKPSDKADRYMDDTDDPFDKQ